MVIWIDPQRHGVGNTRNGMWRLEHLAGVAWMVIGEIILHALGNELQHTRGRLCVEIGRVRGQSFEALRELRECIA